MRELWRRLAALLRREAIDRDLDEELRFHLEMKARETGDARTAARAVGPSLLWRERARDAWGWRWLDELAWDVRYVCRVLRANPAFTTVALVTLTLGIGLNAAVFTIVNGLLFRGFPHIDPNNRVVYLDTSQNGHGCCLSYPDFEDWRTQATSFDGMAAVSTGGLRLRIQDATGMPATCDATQLTVNAFRVLGQRPMLGRTFLPSDDAPGAGPVAILSYGFWARRYGRNPAIVGETVRLNDTPTTVIGVMGGDFEFPHHRVDLWLPLVRARGLLIGSSTDRPTLGRRDRRALWFAFGRLAEGATIGGARAEMYTIGRRLERAYPLSNRGYVPRVRNFDEFFVGPPAAAMYEIVWAAVGCVLLIACANLANLLLGRAIGRSRELSIRMALGAGRWRIVRQLLIESVVLSGMGGVLGWWTAARGVQIYQVFATPPGSYERWNYSMDHRVLAYLAGTSLLTGLVFGLGPALHLSRVDVNANLKDGGRGAIDGGRGRRLSTALVIAETALALLLLTAAGLMVRSFLSIYTAEIGVRAADILTAEVRLPPQTYPDRESQTAFFRELTGRLAALPGVESVALSTRLPTVVTPRVPYELADVPPPQEQRRPDVLWLAISPNYFETLGATVVSGRTFVHDDETADAPVAIVNRRFARAVWPGQDAVGKRLRLLGGTTPGGWRTVVGLASDIVQNDSTGQRFEPIVYVPFWQQPANGVVLARTHVPPESLAAAFRDRIATLDPGLVIYSGLGSIEGPKTLVETLAFNSWKSRTDSGLLVAFSALALLLASIGLYGVLSHSVGRRTQEIGVRRAIGATGADIVALVFRQGMAAVGAGLVIGLIGSVAVNQFLKNQLVGISPFDSVTLVVTCSVLVLAAAIACWVPARRATRVDPMVALRHD